MRWFENYRIEWIKEMVEIYGFINRSHIMKKFGVSIAQASLDLSKFQERYPGMIEYNKNIKEYKIVNGE